MFTTYCNRIRYNSCQLYPIVSLTMQYHFSVQVCLLLFSSLCLSTKAQDRCPPCERSNVTYICRSLPTLGAKVRLCFYNTTPNATLDVVFSVPVSPDGWAAWGLNPIRPQMVDAQVLTVHRNPDNGVIVSQVVLTHDTKHGCGVSDTGFDAKVYRASANYSEESKMMILYAKLGLPWWCNLTRFNHVWQVGPGMNKNALVKHPRTLKNFDSRETINLTNGHVFGRKFKSLRKVSNVISTKFQLITACYSGDPNNICLGTIMIYGNNVPGQSIKYHEVYIFKRPHIS
jgi:Protein of unknown function (DUF568)